MRETLLIGIALLIPAYAAQAEKVGELKDEVDRSSYVIGQQIGGDFKRQGVPLDAKSLIQGIEDGLQDKFPRISGGEMKSLLSDLKKDITKDMRAETIARVKSRREKVKLLREEGEVFRQHFAQQDGVVTTESGLQYRIIRKGSGPRPDADDYVTFNYRAKTQKGWEYDSSYKKGQPATYRANAVTPGFTEVIQLMQPGAKWEAVFPPQLAYRRKGPLANQSIKMELELLSIQKN